MPSVQPLHIVFIFLVCCVGFSQAFGAGNVPSFAFLEGKAWRHGDIADILADMLIRVISTDGGVVFDYVKQTTGLGSSALGGEKFSPLNVKRTYFGNWLYCSVRP
jgi:Heterokaryon incompatibility protein Het-C